MTKTEKNIIEKIGDKEISTAEFTKREIDVVWHLVSTGILKQREGEMTHVQYDKAYQWGRHRSSHHMYYRPIYISKA